MTTMSIPIVGYAQPRSRRRLPVTRRLVLATGLALVSWSRAPQRPRSHEAQARQIQTEASRARAGTPFRYGIAQ